VRDADGLRFFVYDWRGLVTQVNHRFWSQKDGSGRAWDDGASDLWSTGSTWDPAIPNAARASLTDWLVLDDLTDTTTVTISTSYDAASRPTRIDYPEAMATRFLYNDAATLDAVEMDRGTGAGFFAVVQDLRYDARGKLTALTHGNGVVTERTYDTDLERLLRISTELPGAPDVAFQDLRYAYDPAGNPVRIEDALSTSTFKANHLIPNTRTFFYLGGGRTGAFAFLSTKQLDLSTLPTRRDPCSLPTSTYPTPRGAPREGVGDARDARVHGRLRGRGASFQGSPSVRPCLRERQEGSGRPIWSVRTSSRGVGKQDQRGPLTGDAAAQAGAPAPAGGGTIGIPARSVT
jgi:YD repeat-containing protein